MKRLFWIQPMKDEPGAHMAIIREIFVGGKAKQRAGLDEDTYFEHRVQINDCTTSQDAVQEARFFIKGYVEQTAHEGKTYEVGVSEGYPPLMDLAKRAREE